MYIYIHNLHKYMKTKNVVEMAVVIGTQAAEETMNNEM